MYCKIMLLKWDLYGLPLTPTKYPFYKCPLNMLHVALWGFVWSLLYYMHIENEAITLLFWESLVCQQWTADYADGWPSRRGWLSRRWVYICQHWCKFSQWPPEICVVCCICFDSEAWFSKLQVFTLCIIFSYFDRIAGLIRSETLLVIFNQTVHDFQVEWRP